MDNYNLTWKTFSKHLTETVQEMFEDKSFANVTLVCEGQRQLRAHKFVLSARSSVFKSILQYNSAESNPLIILRGIRYEDMEAILQFMYQGETCVSKDRIKDFMKTAEELEVKIISKKPRAQKEILKQQDKHSIDLNYENKVTKVFNKDQEKAIEDRHQEITEIGIDKDPTEIEDTIGRNENAESTLASQVSLDSSNENVVKLKCFELLEDETVKLYFESDDDSDVDNPMEEDVIRDSVYVHSTYEVSTEDLGYKSENNVKPVRKKKDVLFEPRGAGFKCDFCDYEADIKSTVTRHVKSRHEFPCTDCGYVGRLRRDLTTHIRLAHPKNKKENGQMFSCQSCTYIATKKCHLVSHIRFAHQD